MPVDAERIEGAIFDRIQLPTAEEVRSNKKVSLSPGASII